MALSNFNSHTHIGCDTTGIPSPISIPISTRDASLGQEHPYEHIDISIPASTRDASGFAVFHKLAVLFQFPHPRRVRFARSTLDLLFQFPHQYKVRIS